MSRDIHNICSKILDSNRELHYGSCVLDKEIQSIKNDIKKLEKRVKEIYAIYINKK